MLINEMMEEKKNNDKRMIGKFTIIAMAIGVLLGALISRKYNHEVMDEIISA